MKQSQHDSTNFSIQSEEGVKAIYQMWSKAIVEGCICSWYEDTMTVDPDCPAHKDLKGCDIVPRYY